MDDFFSKEVTVASAAAGSVWYWWVCSEYTQYGCYRSRSLLCFPSFPPLVPLLPLLAVLAVGLLGPGVDVAFKAR